MNFLYLYPCYSEAREAWEKKCTEIGTGAFSPANLSIHSGQDYHKFNYVPIRVHVDLERLGMVVSVLHLQPLIDSLLDKVSAELIKLNDYVISATRMEIEDGRTVYNQRSSFQAPDDAASGGSPDSRSTELGPEDPPQTSVLQGRLDL